ncbi:MAG: Crp/Fnr family transcriptional regulator [Ruminococcus sp.]|nr:Crp/Fnr family transcriptional regulator [Ruminococcus sp.]
MKNRAYIKEIFDSVNYTRKFSKGSIIYHQGDYASSFYYLKKGKVRVYMTSPDGVEHTLSTASSGEILGEAAFFDKMPRISSANALSNIEVAVINEETLLTLTRKYPKLALELLNLQATRIRQLSSQLDAMTFLKANERIAKVLLQNTDDNNEVSLTHEEIAGATGVTRVTVSKILREFKDKGILKTEYRKIIMFNSEKLQHLVKE